MKAATDHQVTCPYLNDMNTLEFNYLFSFHKLKILKKEFIKLEKEYLDNQTSLSIFIDSFDYSDITEGLYQEKIIKLNILSSKVQHINNKLVEIVSLIKIIKCELYN